jgi:predicted neuraminidase
MSQWNAAVLRAVCVLALTGGTAWPADNPSPAMQHVMVYHEAGRFGGWPANHGIWSWGDEILVGFSAGTHKDNGPNRHAIDHDKPEEHLLARSRDGGLTWSIENPSQKGALIPVGPALHGVTPPGLKEKPWRDCPGGIDFTHPDFALTVRMTDVNAGPSRFSYSTDRGHTWEGPFRLPLFDQKGIAARTDYVVNGKHDLTLFLTAAKRNGREGRPLCVRTIDGGKTWKFVAWIADEPAGYAIMPSTVRLGAKELLTAVRHREESKAWIETYRSLDDGATWKPDTKPAPDLGEGNPASMIRLTDGTVCLTYGQRRAPFGIRARLSKDGGRTWGDEIVLRDDGGGRDLGYPRSVQRRDGKVVTVYYLWGKKTGPERYVAATIWDPKKLALSRTMKAAVPVERVFGPEDPGGRYKHPASIAQLANGDLYLAYYCGSGEYADDTAVFGARLPKGEKKWTKPEVIADTPYRSEGNPVIWQAPDGKVWLFYVVRYGKTWSTSLIQAKISNDGAKTWSDPMLVTTKEGMMVRSRPLALADGGILLPAYHETGNDPEKVGADSGSLFFRWDAKEHTWTPTAKIRSRIGNIQPSVARVKDDLLVCYCRRGGGYDGDPSGRIVRSESHDDGRTWSEGKETEFKNPNAAVEFLRLKSGNLLLIYNDSTRDRMPLTAALSTDGDKTYPHRRNLIEGRGDFAYPYAIQTDDGKIHLVFTSDRRTAIYHAVFTEEDVRGHRLHESK